MRCLNNIFPMIANWKDNKIIRDKLTNAPDSFGILSVSSTPDKIKDVVLENRYTKCFEQKNSLEDKAKINIAGITIAISLIMGANSVIKEISTKMPFHFLSWAAIALMILAVFYMISAGWMSIKVIIDENRVELIDPIVSAAKENRGEYDRCISHNTGYNLIRNNYVYSSYECIRNALVCLFLIFLMSVIPMACPEQKSFEKIENNYFFYYEKGTLPLLSSNSIYVEGIEKSVNMYIDKMDKTESKVETAIIDIEHQLFIQFQIENDIVRIINVETYENIN